QPGDSIGGAPRSLLDQGWMAGPVANIKLASGLSLDAQAAWGVAHTAADDLAKTIAASRSMVSARLANVQSTGPWRLTPSLSVSHFQDGQLPAPAVNEVVAPHGVGYGRVDLGPEVAYRIDTGGPLFIEPKLAVGTFWGFDTFSKLAPSGIAHTD